MKHAGSSWSEAKRHGQFDYNSFAVYAQQQIRA